MTKQTKFILAIVLQLVIIFAIIIFKVAVLTGGTDILLQIEPIDPRSPLRGDYLTFQYQISNLDSYLFGGSQIRNGDTVYVVLKQRGRYWKVGSVQKSKPADNNTLFIKGRVASGGLESQSDFFPSQRSDNSHIHVLYGIEEYFIPEGKGSNFVFRNKEVAGKVVVDENGNAVLKQIYVDDKPWP